MNDAGVIKDITQGEHHILSFLRPDSLWGALIYLGVFVLLALLMSRILRAGVHASMTRKGHFDRTTISFLQQFGTVLIWVVVLILYAHLIPMLRSMGTALLAGRRGRVRCHRSCGAKHTGQSGGRHFDRDLSAVPLG